MCGKKLLRTFIFASLLSQIYTFSKGNSEGRILFLPNKLSTSIPTYYYKIQTYLELNRLGCPVPLSVLILDIKGLTQEDISNIRSYLSGEVCSLRYQYIKACSNPKRGGRKAPISKDVFIRNSGEDFLLWPVEHIDRVRNKFGVNILLNPSTRTIKFEIVGRGFDGTDLNKGDISPHQIVTLRFLEDRGTKRNIMFGAKNFIVSKSDYLQSRNTRIKKLLDLGLKNGEISIPESYTPIPLAVLSKLDNYARRVFKRFDYKKEINISATVMDNGRIIFWDFQTPENKSSAFFGSR